MAVVKLFKISKLEAATNERRKLGHHLLLPVTQLPSQKMRGIGEITIQERRYRLNIYPRCFVGSEATTWLVRKFFIADTEAVNLG
jgi:Domain found in Dishevelled, Egl-10, and Pleckstrin (DEP)